MCACVRRDADLLFAICVAVLFVGSHFYLFFFSSFQIKVDSVRLKIAHVPLLSVSVFEGKRNTVIKQRRLTANSNKSRGRTKNKKMNMGIVGKHRTGTQFILATIIF